MTPSIRSDSFLYTDDLLNLATQARNEYGYLGTAAMIVKALPGSYRAKHDDDEFERRIRKVTADIRKLHNGYLGKWESVYTDSYQMLPYMLDEKLNRAKKQPKFVKQRLPLNSVHIAPAVKNDNAFNALKQIFLQSCGGFHLDRVEGIPVELNVHKCVRIHHQDPYTKLGPFKVEHINYQPFFMIIHELFTDEDSQERFQKIKNKFLNIFN